MLDFQRGRFAAAGERCDELLVLGDKLRGGSEEPFARAIMGLRTYALDDNAEALNAALGDLRAADAKHRLAYVLTRAAVLDCERGRAKLATERASEALGYATLLSRATEVLLANAVLSHQCNELGDRQGAARFVEEVKRIRAAGAAAWTDDVAVRLTQKPQAKRKEKR